MKARAKKDGWTHIQVRTATKEIVIKQAESRDLTHDELIQLLLMRVGDKN